MKESSHFIPPQLSDDFFWQFDISHETEEGRDEETEFK